MDDRISIRSGAEFDVALEKASVESAVRTFDRPLDGRHAIVVDEHPLALAMVVDYLVSAGCEVVSFTSFADAKHHLMASVSDILITDLRLGAFNGLQLVWRAKSRWPNTIAVVFSGFDDPVLRHEAERMGAAFLLMPLTRASLVHAVMAPPSM